MRPKTSFQVPGFFFRAATSGSGTGPANSLLDSGEKSRTLPSEPGSFSTCIMITVRSASSISRRCFIMAT